MLIHAGICAVSGLRNRLGGVKRSQVDVTKQGIEFRGHELVRCPLCTRGFTPRMFKPNVVRNKENYTWGGAGPCDQYSL